MGMKVSIVMTDGVSYVVDKEFESYRNAKGWFLKGMEKVAIDNGKASASFVVIPVNGGIVMVNPFRITSVEFEEVDGQ